MTKTYKTVIEVWVEGWEQTHSHHLFHHWQKWEFSYTTGGKVSKFLEVYWGLYRQYELKFKMGMCIKFAVLCTWATSYIFPKKIELNKLWQCDEQEIVQPSNYYHIFINTSRNMSVTYWRILKIDYKIIFAV